MVPSGASPNSPRKFKRVISDGFSFAPLRANQLRIARRSPVLAVLVVLWLALRSARHVPFFAIAAAPVLAST